MLQFQLHSDHDEVVSNGGFVVNVICHIGASYMSL